MDDIRDRRSGCGTDHRDRRLPYFFQMCTAAVSCVFCGASFPEKTDDRKRIRGNTEKSVSE